MESIILASASPRRKDLLSQIHLPFEVICSDTEEVIGSLSPCETVQELAKQKAEDVVKKINRPGKIVLGADTVVSFKDEILGKPKDREDAVRMIRMLQGESHQVYTGVCFSILTEEGKIISNTFYEETTVFVFPMSEREIESYMNGSIDHQGNHVIEWCDKAGAYGIQGQFAAYIQGIRGDYNNVVGLPVARVYQKLKQWKKQIKKGD